MRELNTNEIAVVNGAGLVTTITGGIGSLIGSVSNIIPNLFGLKLDLAPSFKLFGQAVGSLMTLDFKVAGEQVKQGFEALFPKKPATPAA